MSYFKFWTGILFKENILRGGRICANDDCRGGGFRYWCEGITINDLALALFWAELAKFSLYIYMIYYIWYIDRILILDNTPCLSIRRVIRILASDTVTVTDTVFVKPNQYSQILRRQCCLINIKHHDVLIKVCTWILWILLLPVIEGYDGGEKLNKWMQI